MLDNVGLYDIQPYGLEDVLFESITPKYMRTHIAGMGRYPTLSYILHSRPVVYPCSCAAGEQGIQVCAKWMLHLIAVLSNQQPRKTQAKAAPTNKGACFTPPRSARQ